MKVDTDWVVELLVSADAYCNPNKGLTKEQLLQEMKRASTSIREVLSILQKARYGSPLRDERGKADG